jgi:hypothetical protein
LTRIDGAAAIWEANKDVTVAVDGKDASARTSGMLAAQHLAGVAHP